uniref:Uncharacterized protein n=1 Tax=Lotus japonicus TaxID=34305 RepID=I3SQB6_LOTJA|nr:unknown [Lotus japonicus]
MRVVIAEHGHGFLFDQCSTNWLPVIPKIFTIAVSMLVRRGRLVGVIACEGMVFWLVRIWPQLCSPASFPYCS